MTSESFRKCVLASVILAVVLFFVFMDASIAWVIQSVTTVSAYSLLNSFMLTLLSVTGVFLSTNPSARIRMYGIIVAMCSQPFWFYSAITTNQIGVFAATIIFTVMWLYRADTFIKNNELGN